jgi:SPP1 gp7 family putative phage head morphogenesis protein
MDVAFTRPNVDNLLTRPIHRSTLQTLYTRTYENLESVRDDVAQGVREELVTGLLEGRNPRDIGRDMTDRVDSIGKHRATMIARTETMNAYSEGFLNRTDELADEGDFDVAVSHKEWLTARDDRVCPICNALDGTNFTTREMRNNAFEIGGTTFRLRPPAHPNCRCSMTVSLGVTSDDVAPLDERIPTEDDIQQ